MLSRSTESQVQSYVTWAIVSQYLNSHLLDSMARILPRVVLKIWIVVRFETRSSVAQYLKAYLDSKLIICR